MMRLVLFLAGVLALAAGLAWLADRPGNLVVTWQEFEIETTVFRAAVILTALVGLAILAWTILRQIWSSPAAVSHLLTRRRQRRGLDALSSGMIAIGAGDRAMATRYAVQARKSLPNEPLTHLLRAQAAQLSGDKATARRIFEAMLGTPDTEQLGLRGLFLEAGREGEAEAQRQFAERALRLNPKLSWAVEALFTLQCKSGDWEGALATLAAARKYGHIERPEADRRRAVLLTAQAQALEDDHGDKALTLALEAHGLAPGLIPAAAIAGRLLASRGNTGRAAKVLQKTWTRSPHPDLATAYAYARIGDSPRDRFDRVKQLTALTPFSPEAPVALATAAIEAHLFDEARHALAPFLERGLTRRIAMLMARVEGEEHGDRGRVREWLARAVNAARDPAWTADGVVADRWMAVSPVTGAIDAFEWRVPVEDLEQGERAISSHDLDGLMAIEAAAERTIPVAADAGAGESADAATVIDAKAVTAEGAGKASTAAPATTAVTPKAPASATPRVERTQRPAAAAPAAAPPQEPGARTGPPRDAGGAKPRKGETGRTIEPAIFTPPRAPDDPGADAAEGLEPDAPLRPYRA